MSRVERMPYLMTLPFVFKINIIINGLKTGFNKSWSLYLSRTNSLKDMAICQSKKWKFRQNLQLGKFKYLTMVCLSVLYFGKNDLTYPQCHIIWPGFYRPILSLMIGIFKTERSFSKVNGNEWKRQRKFWFKLLKMNGHVKWAL